MTDFTPLIERVEAASGADRELDCLLFEAFNPEFTPAMRGMIDHEPTGEYYYPTPPWPGAYISGRAPNYTASIDAALALVERVRPGAHWRVQRGNPAWNDGSAFWATAGLPGEQESGTGATPALALLAALLRALQAQQEGERDG